MIEERIVRIATDEEVRKYTEFGQPKYVRERMVQRGFDLQNLPISHILLHVSSTSANGGGFYDWNVLFIPGGLQGTAGYPDIYRSEENSLRKLNDSVESYVMDRTKVDACSPFWALTNGARYSEVRKAFEKQGCRVIDLSKGVK